MIAELPKQEIDQTEQEVADKATSVLRFYSKFSYVSIQLCMSVSSRPRLELQS